jgi:glutamine phosphoribosylpyrophosphate amidotransferase
VEIDASFTSPLDQMLCAPDTLAKSFYSAISADMGMVTASNTLTNEATLQSFTRNYSDVEFNLVSAGPASDSYENLKAVTGKSEVAPSTIFTSYLCRTPERKLTTALIVSVLLANLVLLRALWSIMTFVAVHVVASRDPNGVFRCV